MVPRNKRATETGNVLATRRDAGAIAANMQRLNNRARALIEQAFDLLEADRARGRRDFVRVLADQMFEDPLSALERIHKLLPPEQPGAFGGLNSLNINHLYLAAVQQANRDARVVEHDPAPAEREPVEW